MINLQTPGGTAEMPDDSFPMSAVFLSKWTLNILIREVSFLECILATIGRCVKVNLLWLLKKKYFLLKMSKVLNNGDQCV